MPRLVRPRWAHAACLLLLAAFAAGLAGDFVHTDDGCQVEIHCLACQRTLASVGVAATDAIRLPSIAAVDRIAPRPAIAGHDADSPATPSRAPPFASN